MLQFFLPFPLYSDCKELPHCRMYNFTVICGLVLQLLVIKRMGLIFLVLFSIKYLMKL